MLGAARLGALDYGSSTAVVGPRKASPRQVFGEQVASTILHEQGWPHEHIELQLAHQERDDTSAAYNHALYLKPRAEKMQSWADHLDSL